MQRSVSPVNAYSELGIVLHAIKYSDNKLIIHLLTQNNGRMNYIATISPKVPKNIFQPLTIIEFQAVRTKTELGKINTAEIAIPLHEIPFDVAKSTIAIFISELLFRVVKEPLDDKFMFEFAKNSIVHLNGLNGGVANFHIWFLIHFAYFMGYQFPQNYNEDDWLDIKNGYYTPLAPIHKLRIAPQYACVINQLNNTNIEDIDAIKLNRVDRSNVLSGVVDYYSFHCDTFSSVKSIEILAQVF